MSHRAVATPQKTRTNASAWSSTRPLSTWAVAVAYMTQKGKDLADVLVTMHAWGSKHLYGDMEAGVVFKHMPCGQQLKPRVACDCCGEIVKRSDIEMIVLQVRPTVGEILSRDEAA